MRATMNRIVDAHHHIWRQRDLPWLMGPMQPRIFGPYEPIRRDYAIEEYLGDIEGSGVAQSIYVQANWAPGQAVDEVAWVQAEADRTGYPHAIVGYADLRDPDVGAVLEAQSQYPLLRGIRMQLHWHENEQYRFADGPAVMNDAALRARRRAAGEARPRLRAAGLHRADGRRRRLCRGVPRRADGARPLRNAGGPHARGLACLA